MSLSVSLTAFLMYSKSSSYALRRLRRIESGCSPKAPESVTDCAKARQAPACINRTFGQQVIFLHLDEEASENDNIRFDSEKDGLRSRHHPHDVLDRIIGCFVSRREALDYLGRWDVGDEEAESDFAHKTAPCMRKGNFEMSDQSDLIVLNTGRKVINMAIKINRRRTCAITYSGPR